jgi:hypothetical protein
MPYNFWNSEMLPSKSLIHQHRQRFCPDGAGFAPAFLLLPTLSPDGAIMGYALPKYRAFGGISAALLSALCPMQPYALCTMLSAPCSLPIAALCPMPYAYNPASFEISSILSILALPSRITCSGRITSGISYFIAT